MRDPVVRISWGATATRDRDDLETVKQRTHDYVIEDLGAARTSPVSWRLIPAPRGARLLGDDLRDNGDRMSAEQRRGQRELIAFLRSHPGGWLVAATAEADPALLPDDERAAYEEAADG